MKRLAALALLFGCAAATPSFAALKPGDAAPDFTAMAALGGEEFSFSLAAALKKGPVVLYFFPKAFTTGCTAEAHEFAAAHGIPPRGWDRDHYDVPADHYDALVAAGAVPVSSRELVRALRAAGLRRPKAQFGT